MDAVAGPRMQWIVSMRLDLPADPPAHPPAPRLFSIFFAGRPRGTLPADVGSDAGSWDQPAQRGFPGEIRPWRHGRTREVGIRLTGVVGIPRYLDWLVEALTGGVAAGTAGRWKRGRGRGYDLTDTPRIGCLVRWPHAGRPERESETTRANEAPTSNQQPDRRPHQRSQPTQRSALRPDHKFEEITADTLLGPHSMRTEAPRPASQARRS